MVGRSQAIEHVRDLFRTHPGVAILGPRQYGKVTLARVVASEEPTCTIFDLESSVDIRRLSAPMRNLGALSGLVVIDEIQHRPELFEILRVLIDRPEATTRFLILGRASPSLVKEVSESLAGRVGFLDLGGFDLRETGAGSQGNSGSEEDSHGPSWPLTTRPPSVGVRISCEPCWSATFRNWVFRSPLRRYAASGL